MIFICLGCEWLNSFVLNFSMSFHCISASGGRWQLAGDLVTHMGVGDLYGLNQQSHGIWWVYTCDLFVETGATNIYTIIYCT